MEEALNDAGSRKIPALLVLPVVISSIESALPSRGKRSGTLLRALLEPLPLPSALQRAALNVLLATAARDMCPWGSAARIRSWRAGLELPKAVGVRARSPARSVDILFVSVIAY
jgi:hypothetical protein